ncbi:protein WVD2-like 7 isoform X1 [Canna indica]|uniref:Protein WVD2-like 7 isoform X1 n=1 Tax=Canna indica TaxID=4628 RepID=A0AAQ3Q2U5_9LILI|nr:protein WVD2-like 7 isoform X1 [Canna indica]
MTTEIEDSIIYQDERSLSGSISFGRFEAETLSWERRSSFSHNRYLEDVEKYATPGSVNQKKAYFEAHFKNRPLLYLTSLGSQNEAIPQFSKHCTGYQRDNLLENGDNEHREFTFNDEMPAVFDDHKLTKCEQEETLSLEFSKESTSSVDQQLLVSGAECDEAHQTQLDGSILEYENSVQMVANENHEHDTGDLLHKVDFSSELPADIKDNAASLETKERTSTKGNVEKKSTEEKPRNQLPNSRISRKLSNKSSHSSGKMFAKDLVDTERSYAPKAQSEKKLTARTSQNSSDVKSQKTKDAENMKAKARQGNRSDKGLRQKIVAHEPNSVPGKCQADAQHSKDRSARIFVSAKSEGKQSTSVFNFRSDERAEKRKEFYMKLEKKLHAKEVEITKIQIRTQEEAETEIKQLRKSRTFKATPMPSFYREAGQPAPRVPNGKKGVATPSSFSKSESKTKILANRSSAREKSPSCSKIIQEGSSSGKPPNGLGNADNHQERNLDNKIEARRKDDKSKLNEHLENYSRKKEVRRNITRTGVGRMMKGIADRNLAVQVAS